MVAIYACPECGADVERTWHNGVFMCMRSDDNGRPDSCGVWHLDELDMRERDENNVPIREVRY